MTKTKDDFFNSIAKVIDNEYAGVASEGTSADIAGFIDTGSYVLNALFSGTIFGGLPGNKITALAGEEATGKTFFLLGIIKSFLDSDPKARCFFFESEGSVTKAILESRGIDTDRVYMLPVETVQQFKTQALRVVQAHLNTPDDQKRPLFLALDSLGMLSTTKEMEDSESGKETRDMTRAQIVKATFRTLTVKLSKANIPCVITNHVYTQVGQMYAGKEMGGGSGLKYASNNIVFLTKSQLKDGTERIGSYIRCTNKKSRLTREMLNVITKLTHSKGLDRYYGLVDLAVDAGIFKKVSTRVELPDGRKLYEKNIYQQAEDVFTEDVLKAIDEHVAKTFLYGAESEDEVLDEILEETEAV